MSHHQSCLAVTAAILFNSTKILYANKSVFFSIFVLLALPLSSLIFYLCLSSFPIKARILHLEAVSTFSSTRFEARHIWRESREYAVSLLYLKLLYFFPSYLLSLLISISTISAAHSASSGLSTSLESSISAVKSSWARSSVTSICIYVILFLYSYVPQTLAVLAGSAGRSGSVLRLVIWVIGWGVEVYLMAIMGTGLVVSITERRLGFVAIRIGSDLMEARRACGWVLSGLLASLTGLIGWKMEVLMMATMDGRDLEAVRLTAVMGLGSWKWVGLICLYGLVVIWGYVVSTVFYCECRKRQVIRAEDCEDSSSS